LRRGEGTGKGGGRNKSSRKEKRGIGEEERARPSVKGGMKRPFFSWADVKKKEKNPPGMWPEGGGSSLIGGGGGGGRKRKEGRASRTKRGEKERGTATQSPRTAQAGGGEKNKKIKSASNLGGK